MRKISGIPDLTDLYIRQRKSAVIISRKFGVNPSVIYRRLREQGITIKNRKFIKTDWLKLKKLYLSGIGISEIAKEFKCSESAIKTRIYRGLSLPRRKLPGGTYTGSLDRNIKRYGITEEEYYKRLRKQSGLCAICRRKPSKTSRCTNRLHIDHKGERVRGLLCGSCNMGLGLFKDSPKLLQRAIQYLRRNQ